MPLSITPEILAKLEPYLEMLDQEWEKQTEGFRQPTLPLTSDFKVNVRAIAIAIGLKQAQEQHFYKKPDLAAPINAIALAQGVKPIGARAISDSTDQVVSKRFAQISTNRNDLARALAEKEAEIEALREENTLLRVKFDHLEETGVLIRTDWPED